MNTRMSSFIGMVVIVVFLGAAYSSRDRGSVLVAGIGFIVLGPAFLYLLAQFIRGDEES
jgi:hypothetical protein